jgi:hypothetical protein
MLADFAVRLADGLALLLLLTPWRAVPSPFFRTHALVILGLLVLAALDLSQGGSGRELMLPVAGAAALAFVSFILWGFGLPRLALPATLLLSVVGAGVLVAGSRGGVYELWALNGMGRLASAFLMGSTLTAMLLGHYYLTAPAMSIEPLKRFVRCMAWGLGVRALLAVVGLCLWSSGLGPLHGLGQVAPLFLAIRWGMGFAAPVLATWMTWQTVAIRSTQSATGILYIAMTLVLFGELTALILTRDTGVIL